MPENNEEKISTVTRNDYKGSTVSPTVETKEPIVKKS